MLWNIILFISGVYVGQEYHQLPIVSNVIKHFMKEETQKTFIEKLSEIFKSR
jgi:hypothetical protein